MSHVVVVTGASGFLGRFLVPVLMRRGFRVRACGRRAASPLPDRVQYTAGDLNASLDLNELLSGADTVVHLAGRAHLPDHGALRNREVFNTNCVLTARLARSAAKHRVRRFVFVSSIGVLGSCSPPGQMLTEESLPHPDSEYARSKLAAEQQLAVLSKESCLEITTVRPTLVFGPGAPGNVERLMRLVARELPLPFKSLSNRRSFIGVRNLADLLCICCVHPHAGGQVFLAADDCTLSLPETVALLADGMHRRARVWAMPESLLAIGAGLLGKSADFTKLAAPMIVSASKARSVLSWTPSQPIHDAISEAAAHFAYGASTSD
jgi:UDP-4-keto-D-FucNAc 4-reductase